MEIGKSLRAGDVVALFGDLGGGKTTFTKGLAKALGVKENILSPTFVISKIYEGKIPLAHYDFYRIEKIDALLVEEMNDSIGSGEYVTVIEWGERLGPHLPSGAKKITFHYIDENTRKIEVK